MCTCATEHRWRKMFSDWSYFLNLSLLNSVWWFHISSFLRTSHPLPLPSFLLSISPCFPRCFHARFVPSTTRQQKQAKKLWLAVQMSTSCVCLHSSLPYSWALIAQSPPLPKIIPPFIPLIFSILAHHHLSWNCPWHTDTLPSSNSLLSFFPLEQNFFKELSVLTISRLSSHFLEPPSVKLAPEPL